MFPVCLVVAKVPATFTLLKGTKATRPAARPPTSTVAFVASESTSNQLDIVI
jgi:hypothetical protein